MNIFRGHPKAVTEEPQLCALSRWSIVCSRWQQVSEVPTATRKTSFRLIPSNYAIRVGSFTRCQLVLRLSWLEAANLFLQRRWSLNCNYCPGWRSFKFAVTLNIFTPAAALMSAVRQELWSVQCTDIGFEVLIANDILHSCYWLLMANWQQPAMMCDRYRSQCFDVTEDDNIRR